LLAFARRQPLQPHKVEINDLVTGPAKLLRRLLGAQIDVRCIFPRPSTRHDQSDAT
jgi:hypothetical protein